MKKTAKSFIAQLKKNPMFVGIFDSLETISREFRVTLDKNIKICYAYYDYEGYDGSAMVIYYDTKAKKYFEVYGSHCSCYGLEEQWNPSELKLEALELRMKDGYFYDGNILKNTYFSYMGY